VAANGLVSPVSQTVCLFCPKEVSRQGPAIPPNSPKESRLLENLHYTDHAVERMSQRSLTPADIEYVIDHTQPIYKAGGVFFFLGKKQIPHCDRHDNKLRRLEGTTVLVDSLSTWNVITVYRNRQAIKDIRRKAKYDRRPGNDYRDLPLAL
jgi:hypothetical protein